MPTNFNQTLQTVSPSIPSYQPETASSGLGEVFDKVGGAITDFLGQKQAEQEAAAVGAGADEYLNLIQDQSTALADLKNQQNILGEQLANEGDEAKRKALLRQVSALDARSRQMRTDMGPQRIALFRRFVRENPHLVETANKVFGGLQNVAENMLQDSNAVESDPVTTARRALTQAAMALGVTEDHYAELVQLDAKVKESNNNLTLALNLGKGWEGAAYENASTQRNSAMMNMLGALRKIGEQEGAVQYALGPAAADFRARMDAVRSEITSRGGIFSSEQIQNWNQYVNSTVNDMETLARSLPTEKSLRDDAIDNAFSRIAMSGAVALFGNNPASQAYAKQDSDGFYREFVIPLRNQLQADLNARAALPAPTQAKGKGGLLAASPQDTLRRANLDARIKANTSALVQIDQASYAGAGGDEATVRAFSDIYESIQDGTFNPKTLPPGLTRYAYNLTFANANPKNPKVGAAAEQQIMHDQTAENITSYNFSSRWRWIDDPKERAFVQANPAFRATAVRTIRDEVASYLDPATVEEKGIKYTVNYDLLASGKRGNLVTVDPTAGGAQVKGESIPNPAAQEWEDRINSGWAGLLVHDANGQAAVAQFFKSLLTDPNRRSVRAKDPVPAEGDKAVVK